MLNKIQWGRAGRHLECAIDFGVGDRVCGMSFTTSGATEGGREEGRNQQTATSKMYLCSQSFSEWQRKSIFTVYGIIFSP